MRKSVAVGVLGVGVILGYALRPVPAVAQYDNLLPFTVGETVRMTVEGFSSGPTITCKVSWVGNEFISCAGEGQRRPRAVNLRYVQEIAPATER